MPRIRKKTSRRGTTVKRSRIKDKVTESRRKAKKAAKKDVTWKSKKVKDPGIPNNFPYKDQILAEIAEERRQAAEAKERRKEEKKVLRAQQKAAHGANGAHGGDDSGGEDADVDAKDGFDGVATFAGRAKTLPSKSKKSAGTASTIEEDASSVPLLMNPELPHLASVLDKADVVIEILDARDPLSYRSRALERQVSLKEGQRLLLVLNKIDDCPREPTTAWAAHLRAEHPTLFFRAASSFLPHDPTKGKGKEKEPLDDAWGLDAVYALLGRWAREKAGDGPLHVAVVGLANSGKSAFVNSLARKNALDIYAPSSTTNGPTTTPYALEVTLELDGKPVVFIDTPGLAWGPSEDADTDRARHRAQDVLLRNKGRIDHLKDPMPATSYIVSRAETEDLMVQYCLPAFAKGDADAFLLGVARANALIKKGGNPDIAGAARIVLRDWSTGKLTRYAVPPPTPQDDATATADKDKDPALAAIYANDAVLLERLTPRKELRRSRDVVRLSSGHIDERLLAFDAPWFGSAATESGAEDAGRASDAGLDSDGDESAESDTGNEDEDGNASDADADVDVEHVNTDGRMDSDGNEDAAPRAPTRKRKLPPSSSSSTPHVDEPTIARPTKKKTVSFATLPPPLDKKQKGTPDPAAWKKAMTGRMRSSSGGGAARKTGSTKPAANAPTAAQKRKNQGAVAATAAATSEEGAYDFSKFF